MLIFFSYAKEDRSFATSLARKIHKSNIPTWIAQLDVRAAEDWDNAIDSAISQCTHTVAILSPSFLNSWESRSELRMALDEKKVIIPVLYQTCQIPRPLRLLQIIDATEQGVNHAYKEITNTVQVDLPP